MDFESYYMKHVDGLKPRNGESKGLCPIHDDHTPSFNVNLKTGLWHCPVCGVGGCPIDLQMQKYGISVKKAIKEIAQEQCISEEPFKMVKVHSYHDAKGNWLHDKQRWENSYSKKFNYKSATGDKRESESVLYNLPRVIKAKCVIVVEGEKCVDKLTEWDLCGTTLDSGTSSEWKQEHLDTLKGKNIVLLPDNDAIGKEYMVKLAEKLENCKLIELPRLLDKGDIADWDGTKEELLGLIKNAPLWEPERPYVSVRSLVAKVHHDMLFVDPASRGVKTGLNAVDEMGGCFRRQDLIIIGGRPSMGKTAFAVSIMRNMAKSGNPVLLFSLEMSKEQLTERLLCMEKDACMHDITRRVNHDENIKLITNSAQGVADMPIWIDETGGLSIEVFEERLVMAIKELGIRCVFVDYIQLMNSKMKNPEKRNAYIGHISRNLKRIAKENDIPIVVLGQVNRECEKRVNKRPNKADLKDSGDIEQDADVIILLYRDEEYNPATKDMGVAEVIFAKYRNGKTGVAKLAFLEESMRFADLANKWDL